jgi:hypothetical protein
VKPRLQALSSTAFIGLPCPMNSAGKRDEAPTEGAAELAEVMVPRTVEMEEVEDVEEVEE